MPTPPSLSPELEVAVLQAAAQAGQNASVANRMLAWLRELSSGNTTLEKKSEVRTYFENISTAMQFEAEDDES